MDYGALIELIGFDIFLIGLLTILSCYVGLSLWTLDKASDCSRAFETGWNDYKSYLQGCIDPSVECDGLAPPARPARISQLIGMLLMAALLGMVINLVGDRLLDTDSFVKNIPVPFVLSEKKNESTTVSEYKLSLGYWQPEDAIKVEALKSVKNLPLDHEVKDIAKKLFLKENKTPEELEKLEDSAKALFQHANAVALSSNNTQILTLLRYELLVVKVLRTLFTISLILLFIALLGLGRRNLQWVIALKGKKPLRLPRFDFKQSVAGLAGLALVIFLPFLFLTLWSHQSKRYDKKVFHAYTALSGGKDTVVYPLPTPAPLHSDSSMSADIRKN